jgi:hypothetical protein
MEAGWAMSFAVAGRDMVPEQMQMKLRNTTSILQVSWTSLLREMDKWIE